MREEGQRPTREDGTEYGVTETFGSQLDLKLESRFAIGRVVLGADAGVEVFTRSRYTRDIVEGEGPARSAPQFHAALSAGYAF